jgi:hypothetical protein
VIPSLLEISRRFGLTPPLAVLVLAVMLTGIVFFAQSIARWFDDRNP